MAFSTPFLTKVWWAALPLHHHGVLLDHIAGEEEGRVVAVLLQDAKDVLRASAETVVTGSPAPAVGLQVKAGDGCNAHKIFGVLTEFKAICPPAVHIRNRDDF